MCVCVCACVCVKFEVSRTSGVVATDINNVAGLIPLV